MTDKFLVEPQLLWTDSTCVLEERSYEGIPLLVDPNGELIDSASDWLRHMAVSGKQRISSISQYAYALKSFWSYLDKTKCIWTAVNDAVLRTWRNRLDGELHKDGIKHQSTNEKLEVVLRFYLWAQGNGYINGIIGQLEYGRSPFPITIRMEIKRGRTSIKSDILHRVTRKPRNPIPTQEEMTKLYENLGSAKYPETAVRNCLIVDWVMSSGLRREELLSLKKGDLPTLKEAIATQDADQICFVRVTGKGGHQRTAPILPSLVIDTLNYIDGTRQDILTLRKVRVDPSFVFLSRNTGQRLNKQYVSRLISQAFSSPSRKLTLHRIRARFASLLVKHMRQEEVGRVGLAGLREETILFMAAETLGQKDLKSLRYYLNIDIDTEWRNSDMRAVMSAR